MVFFRSHSSSKPESEGVTFIPPTPPVGYPKTFFVSAVLFFAGVFVLYFWALPGLRSALFTKNWLLAEGRVVVSELNKVSDAQKEGIIFSYPHVEYEYSVDGTRFIGNKISLWLFSSGNINESEKTLAFYPKGKTIAVYYNPKNHAESVLQSESLGESLVASLISFILGLIGLYGLFMTLRDFITGRPRPSIEVFER